jgi:hypothetical protein
LSRAGSAHGLSSLVGWLDMMVVLLRDDVLMDFDFSALIRWEREMTFALVYKVAGGSRRFDFLESVCLVVVWLNRRAGRLPRADCATAPSSDRGWLLSVPALLFLSAIGAVLPLLLLLLGHTM